MVLGWITKHTGEGGGIAFALFHGWRQKVRAAETEHVSGCMGSVADLGTDLGKEWSEYEHLCAYRGGSGPPTAIGRTSTVFSRERISSSRATPL